MPRHPPPLAPRTCRSEGDHAPVPHTPLTRDRVGTTTRPQPPPVGAPLPPGFRTTAQWRVWSGPGRHLRHPDPRGLRMDPGEPRAVGSLSAASSPGSPDGWWVLDQRWSSSAGARHQTRFRMMTRRQRRATRTRQLHRTNFCGPPTGLLPWEAGDACVARQGRDVLTTPARHPTRRRQPRERRPWEG